ncbi:uncharacterized protein LOC134601520 isoform X2 [Pelobates fuscus]|uniref:uncharacterized protein LOC134601520 isoform X2 n=1 Tax=Pelobates fuscus TaxID=191477 RepID=UPI002FE4D499
MDVTNLLLIFWSLLGRIHSEDTFCTNQVGFILVEEGGSVTIPCSFSYPKEDWDKSEITVHWRSGENSPCGRNEFIYNHTKPKPWTHENYTGRISMVGDPIRNKTASITIQNLNKKDGRMYCCRLQYKNHQNIDQQWQNPPGTFLRFPVTDKIYVDQLDAVPALKGETVIIPCYITYPTGSTFTVQKVTWRKGDSDLCRDYGELHVWNLENKSERKDQFSLVNFPDDISLSIINVKSSNKNWYCCEVTSESRTYSTHRATELAIIESKSNTELTVQQPRDSSATLRGSVTINCSYNYSEKIDPLWIGIYWRSGSPSGDYVYDPSHRLISPTYKGRTNLRGQADLYIQNVRERDNNTFYYCLVILRVCVGNNKYETFTVHGAGTRLIVSGISIGVIVALVIVLLLVIILCGILIFLYKRGKIFKKSKTMDDGNHLTTHHPETEAHFNNESAYENNSHAEAGKVDAGGVLYAQLNMPPSNDENLKRKTQCEKEPQVLYAAVKTPQSDNTYATVNEI